MIVVLISANMKLGFVIACPSESLVIERIQLMYSVYNLQPLITLMEPIDSFLVLYYNNYQC
jgi:hypothetical protein